MLRRLEKWQAEDLRCDLDAPIGKFWGFGGFSECELSNPKVAVMLKEWVDPVC